MNLLNESFFFSCLSIQSNFMMGVFDRACQQHKITSQHQNSFSKKKHNF